MPRTRTITRRRLFACAKRLPKPPAPPRKSRVPEARPSGRATRIFLNSIVDSLVELPSLTVGLLTRGSSRRIGMNLHARARQFGFDRVNYSHRQFMRLFEALAPQYFKVQIDEPMRT